MHIAASRFALIATVLACSGCSLFQALRFSGELDDQELDTQVFASTCSGLETSHATDLFAAHSMSLDRELRNLDADSLAAGGGDPFEGLNDFELGLMLVNPDVARSTFRVEPSAALASERGSLYLKAYAPESADMLGLDLEQLDRNIEFADAADLNLLVGIFKSPVYKSYRDTGAALSDVTGVDGSPRKIRLSRTDWVSFIKDLDKANATGAWESGALEALGQTARLFSRAQKRNTRLSESELATLSNARRRSLLFRYFESYFRNGKILAANLDTRALTTDLTDRLEGHLTDQQKTELGDEITDFVATSLTSICPDDSPSGCISIGVIGETTFVTRAGKSYGFPGVSAAIDPMAEKKISANKIDRKDLITDVVRVFWEAAGDAQFRVPGAANSTLCKTTKTLCESEFEGRGIPFDQINTWGDRAEVAATITSSLIVRGGWLLALNNETLADVIETTAGVTARKWAEKAAWDHFSGNCRSKPISVEIGTQLIH